MCGVERVKTVPVLPVDSGLCIGGIIDFAIFPVANIHVLTYVCVRMFVYVFVCLCVCLCVSVCGCSQNNTLENQVDELRATNSALGRKVDSSVRCTVCHYTPTSTPGLPLSLCVQLFYLYLPVRTGICHCMK